MLAGNMVSRLVGDFVDNCLQISKYSFPNALIGGNWSTLYSNTASDEIWTLVCSIGRASTYMLRPSPYLMSKECVEAYTCEIWYLILRVSLITLFQFGPTGAPGATAVEIATAARECRADRGAAAQCLWPTAVPMKTLSQTRPAPPALAKVIVGVA
jgi:hypothetical protein